MDYTAASDPVETVVIETGTGTDGGGLNVFAATHVNSVKRCNSNDAWAR